MARPFVLLTDSFKIFRDKVNTVSYNVGDPVLLTTTGDSDLVQSINEVDSDMHGSGGGNVKGDLQYVSFNETVGTGSVVGAINAIDALIGGKASAWSVSGTTVTSALNELDIDIHGSGGGNAASDLTTTANDVVAAINEIEAVFDADATQISSPTSFEHNITGDLTFDVSGSIIVDNVTGKVELHKDGTLYGSLSENASNLVLKSGSTTAVTFSGADAHISGDIYKSTSLKVDVEGDITLDANGADVLLKDNGVQYASLTNVGNQLKIKSGTVDALTISTLNAKFHKPLHTDSALSTTATNVAGGINELEGAVRGTNSTYALTTTAQVIVDAIDEHETDIGNMSFTGLTATNISAAVRELRVELGNHSTLTTTTTSNTVGAINELDAELGNVSISDVGSTVTGGIAQLHDEVGDLTTLDVINAKGGSSSTIIDLTKAANALDTRVDVIEGWTNQDVKTTAQPTFAQVTTAQINRTGNFTVDASSNIILDADAGSVLLKDNGAQYGALTNSSGSLIIKNGTATALSFTPNTATIHQALFLDSALTTVADNVAGAINELQSEIVSNDTDITTLQGRATSLETKVGSGVITTVATNLTGAINELDSDIGNLVGLDALYAGNKGSVVAALNAVAADVISLNDSAGGIDTRVGSLSNLDANFFVTAGSKASIVNAINHIASRTVLVYDENDVLLND